MEGEAGWMNTYCSPCHAMYRMPMERMTSSQSRVNTPEGKNSMRAVCGWRFMKTLSKRCSPNAPMTISTRTKGGR